MQKTLLIRQGRIFLEQSTKKQTYISLKICLGPQIYKYHNLPFNPECQHWLTPEEIRLICQPNQSIQLELYHPSPGIPEVIGEGTIDPVVLEKCRQEEIKIALTYDGMIKGWLYFLMAFEGEQHLPNPKYLYLHKINFYFLEDPEEEFTLSISRNSENIYMKKFTLIHNRRALFPNLKNNIRYSDVIRIHITNSRLQFKPISFLIDHIKRGKTAYYDTWIRNKHNNKAGDLKIEYFLQNLFLENERQVMSRMIVYPHTLSRISSILQHPSEPHPDKRTEFGKETNKETIKSTSEELETTISTQYLNPFEKRAVKTTYKFKPSQLSEGIKSSEGGLVRLRKTKNTHSRQNSLKKHTADFYFQAPSQ